MMNAKRLIVLFVVAALLAVGAASHLAVAGTGSFLYVSADPKSGLNTVEVYDVTKPANGPVRTLKGLNAAARGMASDSAGNLYVSQANPQEPAVVYKSGSTMPSLELLEPVKKWPPNATGGSDVAVAPNGQVYVLTNNRYANAYGNTYSTILVYKKGETKPFSALTYKGCYYLMNLYLCPFSALAIDGKGNVFVAGPPHIIEFLTGSTKAVDTGIVAAGEWPWLMNNNGYPYDPGFTGGANDIQVDSSGNLLVLVGWSGGGYGNAVNVYKPGQIRPSKIIPLVPLDASLSKATISLSIRLDASQKHFFVNVARPLGKAPWYSPAEVDEYTYPGGNVVARFKRGVTGVTSIGTSAGPPPQD